MSLHGRPKCGKIVFLCHIYVWCNQRESYSVGEHILFTVNNAHCISPQSKSYNVSLLPQLTDHQVASVFVFHCGALSYGVFCCDALCFGHVLR